MSHTLTVETKFVDPEAIRATVAEMKLPAVNQQPENITMFDGKKVFGYRVQLPNWNYPVAIDARTGELSYDNYNGSWGKQEHLDKFTQLYDTNATQLAAEALGYMVSREYHSNGTIELTATIHG